MSKKVCIACLLLLPSLLAGAATLSGTITSTNGTPLAGIPLDVLRISTNSGNLVRYTPASTNTDAVGSFTTILLPGDAYWLRAGDTTNDVNGIPAPTGYEALYYHTDGNRRSRDPNAPIIVPGTETNLPGFDFVLSPAVSVTGIVTTPTPVDYTTIDFDVFDALTGDFLPLINAKADTNGHYALHGLRAGRYHIQCNPPAALGLYALYQGDVFFEKDAVAIVIGATNHTLNFQLADGFTISGTVSNAVGPIPGMDIDTYMLVAGETRFIPGTVRTGTAPTGSYQTANMPAGEYVIRADPDPTSFLVLTYYTSNGLPAALREEATQVSLNGASATNIDIGLPEGGRIAGLISRTNVTALAGVDIDVFDSASRRMEVDTASASNGIYSIGALLPGTYIVRADTSPTNGLVSTYYGGAWLAEDAQPVTVLAGTTTTNIDIALPDGGRIQGRITDAFGVPVPNIDLDVLQNTHSLVEVNGISDSNGMYQLGVLLPGSYTIRADPNITQGYVRQYFTNAVFAEDATPVQVLAAQVTSNVNFRLLRGGLIAGHVTDRGGAPLAGIDMDVLLDRTTLMEVTASTHPDGGYSVGPLPPGLYQVRADPSGDQPFVRQYYANALNRLSASNTVVTAGATTTNIDFRLDAGGFISGTVSDPLGTGLAGLDIDIFDTANGPMEVTATTDSNGVYVVGALPDGSYRVRVDPGVSQPWVYQYYTNAVFSEDATPVSVATNSTTLGVDLTLAGGGFLAGQLRRAGGQPVANVDIDVFDLRGARMEINAVSGTDGSYLVGALPGGDYVFRADPEPLQFLARTYYSNAIRSEQAQAVTVTPGTTNAPLDITMAAAGVISGSVFDTNGSALAGIDIDAYDATTGVRVEGNGTSSGNGSYMFGPLRPGTYLVRADPDATQGYVREYFAEVPRKSQANAVTVSADAVTTNIVLTLAPGAAILGRVTDRSSTPLMSIDIDVFPTGGGTPLDQTALTNPDGTYAVGPVPEGMWAVRAHASAAQGYETRYYESAGMISNAAPVAITGGVIVTGIDFSLGTNRSPVAALTAFGGFLSPTGFVVDATASTDANGDRLLVAWRQTGGSPVLLINSNATVATIALPPGYPPGELIELEFVVSDFSTSTTSSTIVVRNGAPLIMDMGHSASQTLYFTWSLGTQAQPYAILTSTNLLSWEQIDSVNTFRHETSPEDAKRFYGIGAP